MKDHYDFSAANRGPAICAEGKTRITIYLDNDILQAFKEKAEIEGKGYQTLINDALKQSVANHQPLTEDRLRTILQEMLPKAVA